MNIAVTHDTTRLRRIVIAMARECLERHDNPDQVEAALRDILQKAQLTQISAQARYGVGRDFPEVIITGLPGERETIVW